MCYNRFRYYSPDSGTYISQDPIGLASGEPNFYAYVSDSNSWVDVFGLSEIFTASNGLSLEVKNVQDLGHLDVKELETIYHANNNPKGFGKSPINAKGETIILHHQKQMNSGPIIEMPRSAHDLGNKKQHPFFPKPHPTDKVDRVKFDEWRKEYWKNRAEIELNKKGVKRH
ncbi:hypothetical protein M4I21_17370 [Cellulophaga sp. 20_2_10]|nr:hypothetical protein [Cellulophaga sp. 20_2_10]